MGLDNGYKVGVQVLYSEVEFKGVKIYEEIKPSKHFYQGIPAAYILYIDYDEVDEEKTIAKL
jgi:hypothetical protein